MLAVYAVVQSHAGAAGTARLLIKTIADEACISYSSAARALRALNAMGVLWWEAQGESRQRTASIYHPLQEANPAVVQAVHAPARHRVARSVRPSRTVSGETPQNVPAESEPQDSAISEDLVRSVVPNGSVPQESSYVQSGDSEALVRSHRTYVRSHRPREEEPSKKNNTSTPPGFDAWWEVWPKKQGKGTARTAYARALKKIPEEELLSKTRVWVAAKPYSDMKFCPMPSTWLNGERWDDDVVPARTGSAGSWVLDLGLTPEQMALAAAVGQ